MKLLYVVVSIFLGSTIMIKAMDSDDEPMLRSWVVMQAASRTIQKTHPEMDDLHTLCKAANQCTRTIHGQVKEIFSRCKIPLSTDEAPQELTLRYDASPINTFLRTLHLLDPHDDSAGTHLIADYQSNTAGNTAPIQLRHTAKALRANLSTDDAQSSTTNNSSAARLIKAAASYPLYPFIAVISLFQQEPIIPKEATTNQESATPSLSPGIIKISPDTSPLPAQEVQDTSVHNQAKYETVLRQGKKLLKDVTQQETHTLLGQLKAQLRELEQEMIRNAKLIEDDRAGFEILTQCILPRELTLTEAFLLQYSKMHQYGASVAHAMKDFFDKESGSLTDITQQAFEDRWRTIQHDFAEGRMKRDRFDLLRQYSYILQTTPSRFVAQAFIDGTLDTYGISERCAHERGLTPQRIQDLKAEFSNCKDFLLQLRRAFGDSIKNIEKVMTK